MGKSVIISIIVSAIVAGGIGFAIARAPSESFIFAPSPTPIPTPLAKYQLEALASKTIAQREIEIREVITEEDEYTSYLFEHSFDPTLEDVQNKIVTGQINIPAGGNNLPLVLMFRGYVDQSLYETGIGTKNAAAVFASNGFITVAPDFLGYAGSSSESGDIFETRFQTYTTALSMLSSLDSIEKWDGKNVFIWAHSNGGQVALTLLSVTKRAIPTTLWAPVTKPFPYSVLYYTDESADGGKFIRRELAQFEEIYDVNLYSFTNYLDRIAAPIQLHQGTADDAIPVSWSDSLVAKLRALELDVTYHKYPGADHNMRPDWNTVVARDLEFFESYTSN